MKAREIMTPGPAVVAPSDEIWRAAEIMKYEDVGCVLVVSDIVSLRLVGLLTDRDISVRCTARRHGAQCKVRDHMTPVPLHIVTPDADIAEIITKMENAHVRRIPVVDGGVLVGIVSEADVAAKLTQHEAIALHREVFASFRRPVERVRLVAFDVAAHSAPCASLCDM